MKLTFEKSYFETEIILGESVYSSTFCDLCRPLGSRIALFADRSLSFAAPLCAFLQKNGLAAELFLLPAGEEAKSREIKQALEDELLEKQYGRDSLFLALGGGSASDLVGFLASSYRRGVPLILMPTTLLAMVDASIGGKTAVDTPFGKNRIGSFYPANAVWMDLAFLDTLPETEWLSGLAEVLKMGLIHDRTIWESLENNGFNPQDKRTVLELIEKTAAAKVSVVERDPHEKALRSILNFGHTVGHAIEQVSRYGWPHGFAVSIGCIGEAWLSHKRGLLSERDLERIVHLIRSLGYPLGPLPKHLLEPMRGDSKNRGGKIRFVLLKEIGKVFSHANEYTHVVEEPLIQEMLDWLYRLFETETDQ